jgi:hypothetical protein
LRANAEETPLAMRSSRGVTRRHIPVGIKTFIQFSLYIHNNFCIH